MKLLSETALSEETPCPYLSEMYARFLYFFALDVSAEELEIILSRGWRKFGMYYFKPLCRNCSSCIPIRLKTDELIPSRSQNRVMKRCANVRTEFGKLEFRDEIFELYRDHSSNRFGKDSSLDDFRNSFYTRSCPAIQSEYFIDNRLAGVGFIDVSSASMSSIYFFYGSEFSRYGLGTFSAFREAEYARNIGLKYYYLGYYIEGNSRMAYKNSFHVNEKMNWKTGKWSTEDIIPLAVHGGDEHNNRL